MSEISRRGFIGVAAAAASLVSVNAAAEEEFSFKNNVPDPLLAGDELPTFKFELEKSEGKVKGGSSGQAIRSTCSRPTSVNLNRYSMASHATGSSSLPRRLRVTGTANWIRTWSSNELRTGG